MLYNAKNGTIAIDNTEIDYIVFGKGSKNLVMIPGLGDGLKTARGMAIPFAVMYGKLVKDYRVYVLSRRNDLPKGFTTKDMAKDVNFALEQLGIDKIYLIGVSQGGMISQHFTIDYPEKVEKLILTVTLARQNDTVQNVISNWMNMAKQGDYKSLMIDTAEKSYSENYLSKKDQIVTGEASVEISNQIPNSELYMYDDYGHGAYEEEKDFLDRIVHFLSLEM